MHYLQSINYLNADLRNTDNVDDVEINQNIVRSILDFEANFKFTELIIN